MELGTICNNFCIEYILSENFDRNYEMVSVSALVYLLFVFKDLAENNPNKQFCYLPKRLWSQYFNKMILIGRHATESSGQTIDMGHATKNETDIDKDTIAFSESETNMSDENELFDEKSQDSYDLTQLNINPLELVGIAV